tara:strand:- start:139 stop:447 length:309 start_codon:yes stop_codon:yes gene_type:complete
MTKLEFLKGRTLITQNDVSFLLNDNKQIQIHYLINDEPNTIQCSLDFIKDACIKQLNLTDKDIHLKYAINNALSKYQSYWGYREDLQRAIVEVVFKVIANEI